MKPFLPRSIWFFAAVTKRNNEGVMFGNNPLPGPALQGSTPSRVKNGSPCPRPECIPWPENEPAACMTHDLHRKRPLTLYNDRSTPKPAWDHSMTYNPSLLSRKIEIDNKTLYWFRCLHSGWLLKAARVHVGFLTTVTTVAAAYICIMTSIWYPTRVLH